jgi:glycosyltransferase involved in cell wall biosynthesis
MTLFAGGHGSLEPDHSLAVPDGQLRRLGFDPRAAYRLLLWLRRNRPDVIVAHGSEPLLYAALVRPKGMRLVYYRIGIIDTRVHRPVRRSLYRRCARRCDLVAGVSNETLADAAGVLDVDGARLRLIPNGRDPSLFWPNETEVTLASTERARRLLWIGHLVRGKRPDWFIDVVAALRTEGVDVEATLVGDGPLEDEFTGPARRAGVAMLGRRHDVPDLLRGSDIVCLTSSGEGEGLPGVLIEAGMSGRPVVSTNVAGATTVIVDGVTGLLVEPDDFDSYLVAVRRLVCDPVLARRMGEAARVRCLDRFTLDASLAKWRRVLDELLLT